MSAEPLLQTLAELSREFGTSDYVQGGGGNTSAKTADTLWVKPSGTTLAGMTPESFVGMDRARLQALYSTPMPTDAAGREAKVKDLMAAAVKPGQTGRASVEAPLHDILAGTFVIHNHPALVNGLTCAKRGAAECARLFPDALWIPYVDPGFTLSLDVRRRAQEYSRTRGRQPTVIILENHGIFVTGDTAESIRSDYANCFGKLRAEYRKAGVRTELQFEQPAAGTVVEEVRRTLRQLLGDEAKHVVNSPPFDVARGPISPDHIVYAKSYPFAGPLTREALDSFRQQHGYWPRVLITEAGVFAVGNTKKKAELALELAQDGALVQQLAAAFGGIQLLGDAARDFIENWEVESYRQQQME